MAQDGTVNPPRGRRLLQDHPIVSDSVTDRGGKRWKLAGGRIGLKHMFQRHIGGPVEHPPDVQVGIISTANRRT